MEMSRVVDIYLCVKNDVNASTDLPYVSLTFIFRLLDEKPRG